MVLRLASFRTVTSTRTYPSIFILILGILPVILGESESDRFGLASWVCGFSWRSEEGELFSSYGFSCINIKFVSIIF